MVLPRRISLLRHLYISFFSHNKNTDFFFFFQFSFSTVSRGKPSLEYNMLCGTATFSMDLIITRSYYLLSVWHEPSVSDGRGQSYEPENEGFYLHSSTFNIHTKQFLPITSLVDSSKKSEHQGVELWGMCHRESRKQKCVCRDRTVMMQAAVQSKCLCVRHGWVVVWMDYINLGHVCVASIS